MKKSGIKPKIKELLAEQKISKWLKDAKSFEQMGYDLCYGLLSLVNEFGKNVVYDAICKASPRFTEEKLDYMASCGARRFPAQLLWDSSPGAELLRSLPYTDAERYLIEKIPVLIIDSAGKKDTRYVAYTNLTKAQAEQVKPEDSKTALKSLTEQEKFLKKREASYARPIETAPREPFIVVNNGIVMRRNTRLARHEILPFAQRALDKIDKQSRA